MKTAIRFEAKAGSIYLRRIDNQRVLQPIPELNNLMLKEHQAEVVADIMTQLYNEGYTTALNKLRAYLDLAQTIPQRDLRRDDGDGSSH